MRPINPANQLIPAGNLAQPFPGIPAQRQPAAVPLNNIRRAALPWYVRNDGQVPQRPDKWEAMPSGWNIVDGYKESWSRDGDSEATIIWEGPWSGRLQMREWLLGFTTVAAVQGSPTIGKMSRTIPAQHPQQSDLYCSRVDLVKGCGAWINDPAAFMQGALGLPIPANLGGGPVPMIAYADNQPDGPADGMAQLAATYRDPGFEIRTDAELSQNGLNGSEINRWVSREVTYAITGLPISKLVGQTLKFTAGPPGVINTVVPEAGVLPIPTQQLIFSVHEWPSINEAAIDQCVGFINQGPFDVAGANRVGHAAYAPGTLLCEAPTRKRTRLQTGLVCWQWVVRLSYRPAGWNSFPDASGVMRPAAIFNAQGQQIGTVYQPSNFFDSLFVPGPPVQWQ